ncbi:hypothetical protein BJ138DRAFT_1138389 [Hygrophoropsis aurantiaca]|uniref:Uncharacterized protein n=1 Tax=Hygrophoropsis aurantiaca TaxID=72124 RepID=A0ACB7ZXE9_9AGAM|nr:hypothetical protein BJ138DRAFT_1138389 [Hygrophoropsis aurantiaca]
MMDQEHPPFVPDRYFCASPIIRRCRKGFKTIRGLNSHQTTIHRMDHHLQPPPPVIIPQHPPEEDLYQDHMQNQDEDLSSQPDSDENENDDSDGEGKAQDAQDFPVPRLHRAYEIRHHILDGTPCDENGLDLPEGSEPHPHAPPLHDPWAPFHDHAWRAKPPFRSHEDMYTTINSIKHGEVPWESLTVTYRDPNNPDGEIPVDSPSWMHGEYEVWYRNPRELLRNQLSNPDFKDEFDYAPRHVFGDDDNRIWSDFMAGNWAWKQADLIAEDPETHGSMFVPVILGSDKKTVTVGTGSNEYYPLYISNGNVHNNVCCAHRNAVSLVGFLSKPKTDEEYKNDPQFRKFCQNLFHTSLAAIPELLHAGMTTPEITMFLLSCIVQRWCAQRCTAHHTDLDGGGQSRTHEHTRALIYDERKANAIIADIDRRIAAVPPFPGLRWFSQGMQAFLDFCYLVLTETVSLPRQHSLKHYRLLTQLFGAPNGLCSSITESKHIKAVKRPYQRTSKWKALGQMLLINQRVDKLERFRVIMTEKGMMEGALLPEYLSNQNEGDDGDEPDEDEDSDDEDNGAVDGPHVSATVTLAKTKYRDWPDNADDIGTRVKQPNFEELIRRFLFDQHNPHSPIPASEVDIEECPTFRSRISIFPSAFACYFSPSDQCGVGGIYQQVIRATESWQGGAARRDCVFAEKDATLPGMQGLYIVQWSCALVCWFETMSDEPCPVTGMWQVKPEMKDKGKRCVSVINIDSIMQSAHLIPIYGNEYVPRNLRPSDSLLAFTGYYVNKYYYHAFEIAF